VWAVWESHKVHDVDYCLQHWLLCHLSLHYFVFDGYLNPEPGFQVDPGDKEESKGRSANAFARRAHETEQRRALLNAETDAEET